MIRHRASLVATLNTILLVGCASSRHEERHAAHLEDPGERTVTTSLPSVPPNHCRVIATVESIDETLKGANDKDPCAKAPCSATIRIDSVLGYGPAFPVLLAPSQKIVVRFAFTLHATKELLPDVKPALPGVSVGSHFEALVGATSVIGTSERLFTIFQYRKE